MEMSSTWDKLKKLLGFGPNCLNGGTKLLSGDCMCPQYFEGKQCEQIICLNDGKPNTNRTACTCPDQEHFRGYHCQTLKCENGGRDSSKGHCLCMDNWYWGRYCENYSSPWGIIVGVTGVVLLLVLVACVLCRLDPCRKMPKRRRRSRQSGVEDERANRNRRVPRHDLEAALTNVADSTSPSRYTNRIRRHHTPPRWPPWDVAPGPMPQSNRQSLILTNPEVIPLPVTADSTTIDYPPPYTDKLDSPDRKSVV